MDRLREELDQLRRNKLELETALLDKDARQVEKLFEGEAQELEISRLKRRVKELQEAGRKGIDDAFNK